MNKIGDFLQLDLSEDIKDVIDLEDFSEDELKFEIQNYIVTNKIAKYLNDFIGLYKSNIKETGVWLSGFYGSGKSYFGKMLGYLMENKQVGGTSFRERFIPRLSGLTIENLLENYIRGLTQYESVVVFLDIAKQNTQNGFAWTLFKNFLRTLGFLDDVFGYMEYGLFLANKYDQFLLDVEKLTGKGWIEIRKNPFLVAETIKRVLTETLWKENTYNETKKYLDDRIQTYDPAKFREELSNYLQRFPSKRIVFMIDEVSEAIGQKKIDLLELEGISEALSTIPAGKVWTIAIAQEKLDDVIQKANVNVQELHKVTDRFKTKIHLSSEEVDTVIRKRLLLKTDRGEKELRKFYGNNSGLVMDSTNLNAKFQTKIDNADDFAIYYPFHKYHFNLMQNFLFAVHKKAKTGGTERGMIIATHAVLKTIKDGSIFQFATGNNLVDGGKKVVDSELERKFVYADRVLKEHKSEIEGNKLLKIIYLLNESEIVLPTAENIAKLYLTNLKDYYEVKPKIEEAIKVLCEANLLLEKNELYKITTDLEQKLIDEMKNIVVEFHYKKRELVEVLKDQPFISDISKCVFEGLPYSFGVITVQGDELQPSPNKYIKFQIASPYTIDAGKRDEYIEKTKFDTQGNQDLATLVPSMDTIIEIDHLIEEIYRYEVLEDRYKNDDDDRIRSIVRDFGVTKQNRLKDLNRHLEKACKNGTLVYRFEEVNLTDGNFSRDIKNIQEKIISNTYTDRLPLQLSEDIGLKILKERDPKKLKAYFTGREFAFFDSDGNFIGERLKLIEKIVSQIKDIYVDGEELEKRFAIPTFNYSYGTIQTVLAVLMRAGRASIKYNGNTYYSYTDDELLTVFSKSREFRKASFKAITTSLTLKQKQNLVDHLKELKTSQYLNEEFNYSTNDIALVTLTSKLANYFVQKAEDERKRNKTFDDYFSTVRDYQNILAKFNIIITDANHKEKAEEFLTTFGSYKEAVEQIKSIIEFIETKLSKIERFKAFIDHIIVELNKLGGKYKTNSIFKFKEEFDRKFNESFIQNYAFLESKSLKIKDEYFALINGEHQEMSQIHSDLKKKTQEAILKVNKISKELNQDIIQEFNEFLAYANSHICDDLKIEYENSCQNCHYTLHEIITVNQNIGIKQNQIDGLLAKVNYPTGTVKPKKINLKADIGEFTVGQYKIRLNEKLNQVKDLKDDDIIIVK